MQSLRLTLAQIGRDLIIIRFFSGLRFWVWRMDAHKEKIFWKSVADNILDQLDIWCIGDKITPQDRYSFLRKLQRTTGLAPEFRSRDWQLELKQEIIERRGEDPFTLKTVKALPFPDSKPRVSFKVGQRSK